jgi:hypothetical protein
MSGCNCLHSFHFPESIRERMDHVLMFMNLMFSLVQFQWSQINNICTKWPPLKILLGFTFRLTRCRRNVNKGFTVCLFYSGAIEQWYSTFFVRLPPDVISLYLYTPKVVCVWFKLYTVYNLHLKREKESVCMRVRERERERSESEKLRSQIECP